MKRVLTLLCGALLTAGCTSMNSQVNYTTETPDNFPVVTAVGYAPVERQRGETKEERVLQAMRASRLEAYRELVEQVQGIQVSGETRVEDLMITDDHFRTQINGVIRGAEVVRSYPVGDYYATELKIDFERVHQLYVSTVRPQRVQSVTYY